MRCPNCGRELVFKSNKTIMVELSAMYECHNEYCRLGSVLIILDTDKGGGPNNE